jgi:hypothetical protein
MMEGQRGPWRLFGFARDVDGGLAAEALDEFSGASRAGACRSGGDDAVEVAGRWRRRSVDGPLVVVEDDDQRLVCEAMLLSAS